jgi:protocatechuate 3,4-dioxygenase beta subunit
VSRIDPERCEPLAGALVDVWQCDAAGVYSGVEDIADRFDTTGKRFLRGHQVTDRQGLARFTTIYPGWYRGRTVHIHFKIRHESERRPRLTRARRRAPGRTSSST